MNNNNPTSHSANNNRQSSLLNSSSLDLDKTLPLPADMEAEMRESQLAYGRQNDSNDDDSNDDEDELIDLNDQEVTNKQTEGINLLTKLQAWTTPNNTTNDLQSSSSIISEIDVANLLSFTTKLHSGEVDWNSTNYHVIQLIVKLAMLSFTGNNLVKTTTTTSTSSTIDTDSSLKNVRGITVATSTTAPSSIKTAASSMEVQFARRLLTDGILPFASFHSSTSTTDSSSSLSMAGVWNAKLIQSIILDHLLPSVLVLNDTMSSLSSFAGGNSGNNNGGSSSSTTTAVDLLLDQFLARMDADEIAQVVRLNPGHVIDNINNDDDGVDSSSTFSIAIHKHKTVDSILDILCNVPQNNASSTSTPTLVVRSTATTAIINSLRDLESNNPGRLSRRRVWRNCAANGSAAVSSLIYINSSSSTTTTTNNNNNNNNNSIEMKECHYTFIDRPTHLLQKAIHTLKTCHEQSDYDSIPPLVYQLGLVPLSVMRRGTNNNVMMMRGKNKDNGNYWCVKTLAEKKLESEKQRGMRLRRMCLDGIVLVLDDVLQSEDVSCDTTTAAAAAAAVDGVNYHQNGTNTSPPSDGELLHSSSKDLFGAKDDDMDVDETGTHRYCSKEMKDAQQQQQQHLEEAWRWARYNSLAHVGAHARSDPEMAKAVLSLLGGEIMATTSTTTAVFTGDDTSIAPFRYQRLTPFKLAMGLAVATAVPRIRTQILETIRDLVMEEETIRIKCGRGITGDVIGLGHPWMDCLVKSVQMAGAAKNNGLKGLLTSSKDEKHNSGIGHVLSNIVAVAKFGADTESVASGVGRGLDLLPSLISLGFLCVDCVKRDEIKISSTNAVPSACSLAPILDISSFGNERGGAKATVTVDTSAAHATASTGRFVLCCLFYQSAASASHYLSSSLTTSDGASSSNDGGTSLCRNILKTSFDKFCAMAPNSLEHSLLLTDLLNFSPKPFRHIFMDKTSLDDGLVDKQREEIIGLCLATNHLRDIIETLSNLIGGGMSGEVARDVISPAIGRLLLVQATQRQGLGSLWKKTDIEDHVDHAFLLAKKALFSADVEKRKAAANLLVALLGAASVASSLGRANTWASVIYEIKGCLRRCLTQHQPSVRMEAYSALIALLPKSAVSTLEASQTQDSVSPASTASAASTLSPLALRSQRGGVSGMVISPTSQSALIRVVSEVLQSSLDRYVTTPKEEQHERDARRKRAAQGVGLSQMEDDDEDGKETSVDKSIPLRFENIISKFPQRSVVQPKRGKSKKTASIGQMLFNEALSRINEPLSFLVASCSAAASLSNDNDAQNELKKALTQLRRRMAACSDIDEYLEWLKSHKQIFNIKDNAKRVEEMAIFKISTLVSVAVLVEAILSTCELENGNLVESVGDTESTNEEVENLFNLRIDAIDRAAEIMSSFISQKSKKTSSKKSKKKLKQVDGNSQDESKESKKTTEKAKKGEEVEAYTTVKSSDINSATLVRNKKLVEEAVHDLSPSMNKEFLTRSLRRFGTNAAKKGEVDEIFDGEESTDAGTRLYGCVPFRRFLLAKSILLTSGSSLIVTPGIQFCSLDEPELDEKLVSFRLATCFSMGPLLLSEFCAYCYQLDKTSAAPNHTLSSDPSLAQLSLRAFSFCVRGMNFHAPNHPMSRAKRVGALISMSMRTASTVVPASKDGWSFYLGMKNDAVKAKGIDIPNDALELKKSLLPFMSTFKSPEDDKAPNRLCLFSELLLNAMYGEALECIQLISAAASAFSEPNMREQLSCAILRAWEKGKGSHVGVLGLDFTDVGSDEVCPLSAVIDVAFQMNHQLEGETHVPLLGSLKNGRMGRSAMGLPLTMIENWPDKHQERLERELKKSGGFSITGVVQQLVLALYARLGGGEHFSDEIESTLTTKEVKLACVKSVIDLTDDTAKERAALGSAISSSIEAGLDNADFVALKMIPHMKASSLDLAQRFVSSILFTVSKVISTSAPFAENVDSNATFSSSLLKSTKRLYSVLVRLILSYMSNPESLASKETKLFLDYITSTFMPKISALLLALSKQTTTKDGKFIAESKIESHGKIAALLVFEKEKLDNALLKVGARLKSAGLEEESAWLEEQVVAVHSRDFDINTDEVENAMAMEAPKEKKTKTKAAGAKRRVKSEPLKDAKKKKKQKAEVEEEEEEDEMMNDSDAVAEVVDGESDDDDDEDSDEESEEDEEESDDDNGISLGNLTDEMGSESEEAEFSD